MIDQITIKNFQSHKESRLKFDRGVNVIIGSSNSGKTSILRALNWVVNNKPSGDSFRRHGEKSVSCEVVVDGKLVTRTKSEYTISSDEGSLSYRTFGQGVPEDVEKLFNLSFLNVQNQMDAPFLLSDSAGEVGRKLNEIVELDIINSSLSRINKQIRTLKTRLSYDEQRMATHLVDLKQYDYLGDLSRRIILLKQLQKEKDSAEKELDELEKVNTQYTEILSQLEGANRLIAMERKISELLRNRETNTEIKQDMESLLECRAVKREIKKAERILGLGHDVDRLSRILVERKAVAREIGEFEHSVDALLKAEGEIESCQRRVRQLSAKFAKLMPNICPLCSQSVERDSLRHCLQVES